VGGGRKYILVKPWGTHQWMVPGCQTIFCVYYKLMSLIETKDWITEKKEKVFFI
jgi:hypothetical protein